MKDRDSSIIWSQPNILQVHFAGCLKAWMMLLLPA